MFTCDNNSGFQLVFANGCRVSVQWSHRNYCENRHKGNTTGNPDSPFECRTAEVAAWDKNDNMIILGNEIDKTIGWQTPDEVLAIMNKIAALP